MSVTEKEVDPAAAFEGAGEETGLEIWRIEVCDQILCDIIHHQICVYPTTSYMLIVSSCFFNVGV